MNVVLLVIGSFNYGPYCRETSSCLASTENSLELIFGSKMVIFTARNTKILKIC